MHAYGQDLAYIHHAGFGDFARSAAPGLLSILRRSGIYGGLVVDLGCGSGIWAGELLKAGYEVSGIDLSQAMIRLARRQTPGAVFRTGSLFRTKLPPCAAVTSIGECINYCFDRSNSRRRLARFFRRVYEALSPGGMFIFDIVEPGQLSSGASRRIFRQGEDWAVFAETTANHSEGTLTRRITAFRRTEKLYRRSEEIHRLRLYRSRDVASDLARAGFQVRILCGYGRFRLPAAHAVIVARKPSSRFSK